MADFNPPFLGKIQRPHFCKEAINIGDFCAAFSKDIDEIMPANGAGWMTMSESMNMSASAINEVAAICSVDQLRCEGEPDPPPDPPKRQNTYTEFNPTGRSFQSQKLFPNVIGDLTGGWGDEIDHRAASKLKSLRYQCQRAVTLDRRFRRGRQLHSTLRYPFELRLEGDGDYVAGNGLSYVQAHSALEPAVSVRIYRSPREATGGSVHKSSPHVIVFSLEQELLCLGSTTLTELRDVIMCANDTLVINDCSQDPDRAIRVTAKEKYPSGFFCIDGTFYVDDRDPRSVDYTEPIREWASERGVADVPRRSMTDVRLRELNVRLGYPYIYVHQGDCRHPMVFSDVRLFRPGVDVTTKCYPRTVAVRRRKRAVDCHLCDRTNASWLTMDHLLTPTNPTLFCDSCFYKFNYRDKDHREPVCSFRAYPLDATQPGLRRTASTSEGGAEGSGDKAEGGIGGGGGGGGDGVDSGSAVVDWAQNVRGSKDSYVRELGGRQQRERRPQETADREAEEILSALRK